MKSDQMLSFFENNWETELGAWFPGEKVVYRDKNLLADFSDISWLGMLVFGITGRLVEKRHISLMEGIWNLSTSFPDPRLWNNRLGALAGTTRSTFHLGIASAIAVTEAKIFGGQPILRSTELLIKLHEIKQKERDIKPFLSDYLQKYRSLPGFGRPIIGKDERIEPVMKLAKSLGLAGGEHLKLVKQVENYLDSKRLRQKANIAAVYGGLMADLGFSAVETYRITALAFSTGIQPCYLDAIEHKEGAFFPLRCESIDYIGSEKSSWRQK